MKGKARRLLSWVCVLALCMSLLPVTALAVNGNEEAGVHTYDAVAYAQIDGLQGNQSANEQTIAYAIWTDDKGNYLIAVTGQKDMSVMLDGERIKTVELDSEDSLTVMKDGEPKIQSKTADDIVGKNHNVYWHIITLTAQQAEACFQEESKTLNIDIGERGHDLPGGIHISDDFIDDTPLGDPEMDPTANPITIEVVLDGKETSRITGGNIDSYITVKPYQNESSEGQRDWNKGTYKDGQVTYSITYYDCKDIGFAAKEGYVIEAIEADLVYGQSGCYGIYDTSNPPQDVKGDMATYGDYMADNVQGGSTVTVYVRSAYTVEYYQVENDVSEKLKSDPYNDTKNYVDGWTTEEPQKQEPQNPTAESGEYYRVCNCNDYSECGHKGFTGTDGSQPAEKNFYVAQNPDTEIKLPVLPDVDDTKDVTGWYLNANCSGDQQEPNNNVPVSTVKGYADTQKVIKFYAKVTDKAQPNISVEKKLTQVQRNDGTTVDNPSDTTTLYADDQLTWTITVTNSGNADATGLKLEDVLKAGDDIRTLDTILKDGQNFNLSEEFTVEKVSTVTFTATYTVTEADEGKTLTNTATVKDSENNTLGTSDTTNEADYTYMVTYDPNSGTLGTTEKYSVYEGGTHPIISTVPTREGYTFTGWLYNGTIYTSDGTNKEINNINQDITLVAQWKETIPIVEASKDDGTDQSVKRGDTIQYTITIQAGKGNQGILKNFSVQDNKFPNQVDTISILLNGEKPGFSTDPALNGNTLTFALKTALEKDQTLTITYSYTVTQGDVAKGEVTNSATVKAWNKDEGQSGTDEDNTVTTPVEPVITLEKKLVAVDGKPYKEGSSVTSGNQLKYQITVENTGGTPAEFRTSPLVVTDTMWVNDSYSEYQGKLYTDDNQETDVTKSCPIDGDSIKIREIPAHAKYVFTYTYTVQQSDEGNTLSNTVSLDFPGDGENPTATVTVNVEKTYCTITYEYESGSVGMQLPTEEEGLPPVPSSETLAIGAKVELPEPAVTQVSVNGGVWRFLGWFTEDDERLEVPVCATGDMTIIGLWNFSKTYTLTYDANGGTFGDDQSEPVSVNNLMPSQTYQLWAKNGENYTGLIPEGMTALPTHEDATTPADSVITDKETVPVVFMGWSETSSKNIYAAGQQYPSLIDEIWFEKNEEPTTKTVYAVWGYDENGDGIADAQQIVITPADITIYTGGASYGGIVENGNGELATENGMPEPGFYFILPYALNEQFGQSAEEIVNLSGCLSLYYQNGNDTRAWKLHLYNEEDGVEAPANAANGHYIYRLVPTIQNIPVRVEIQGETGLVTNDQFDINMRGNLFREYPMTLYTSTVENKLVTAYMNPDGAGEDWVPVDTSVAQGIALGTGTLTIRGTNDEDPVSPIQGDVTAPVEEITAKAAEGTEYTINDSNLPVVNQDAVQLLNDSLVEGSTDALKVAIVDEARTDDSVTITEDYQFDFRYLDLVDTSNGNAYATTDKPLEIYWPYPDGTSQDTTFYIAHFDGLDREFDASELETVLNDGSVSLELYSEGHETLALEKTEHGIKISTDSFSPFALVYEKAPDPVAKLEVTKTLTKVNDQPYTGGSVSVNDTLTYTITVKNGEVALNNVTITDTFTGKGDLNFTLPNGATVSENQDGIYTINLGTLEANATVTITATYKVLRADASSNLVNTAKVTGTNPGDPGNPVTDEVQTPETPVNPYHPPIRPPVDPDKPELNTEDHYAYIVGYEDGSVQPEGDITRAEVATIFFRLLTDESRNEYWSQTNPYSDVSADDWFNNAVSTLTNAGVLDGYEDGTFKPNGNITRAEFATITARFFEATYDGENLFPDIEGHWAQDYINEAANAGIVNGYEDGTFRPQQYITRAEAVTMVNRTIERHPDADHLLDDMITWPDNPETAWYYEQIQEATNSHEYTMNTDDEQNPYEIWTKLLPNRDWSELEKEWSDANDGAGSGEVV